MSESRGVETQFSATLLSCWTSGNTHISRKDGEKEKPLKSLDLRGFLFEAWR